jgi:DNA-binding response OmpR family regulator
LPKILIIEDDAALVTMITNWLIAERYVINSAINGAEAIAMMQSYAYDLLIVDWQLPDQTGIELLRHYRGKGGDAPALILTGKDSMADKEVGFTAGADDYLTKPFDHRELLLRIKALLRRGRLSASSDTLNFGDLTLDPATYSVEQGGVPIKLTPKEFGLLEFFMRHPNQIFSAEQLLDRVWEDPLAGSPESVRVWLNKLRSKLRSGDNSPVISNVFGVGYRFELQKP